MVVRFVGAEGLVRLMAEDEPPCPDLDWLWSPAWDDDRDAEPERVRAPDGLSPARGAA